MEHQEFEIKDTNIVQANIAARDINMGSLVPPVLTIDLSQGDDGSNRWLVIRNEGGSPALEISYSFWGEGYESKSGTTPVLGVGREIPLTTPCANKDRKRQMSDLKRQPNVTVTYKDVNGKGYGFAYPSGG